MKPLQKKLIVFKNPDKKFHEKSRASNGILRHPFQLIVTGPPNSGKLNVTKNIIAHDDFERIVVVHGHPDSTHEYDILDCEIREDIPDASEFDSSEKHLIILDEVDPSNLKKDDLAKLCKVFNFYSTHCNLSVILEYQTFFTIPVKLRRSASAYIIFKRMDTNTLKLIADRVGLQSSDFQFIINNLLESQYDSLLIDNITRTKNGLP